MAGIWTLSGFYKDHTGHGDSNREALEPPCSVEAEATTDMARYLGIS